MYRISKKNFRLKKFIVILMAIVICSTFSEIVPSEAYASNGYESENSTGSDSQTIGTEGQGENQDKPKSENGKTDTTDNENENTKTENSTSDEKISKDNIKEQKVSRKIKRIKYKKTYIKKVKRNVKVKNYRKNVYNKISVYPAYGRKVRIQRYDRKSGKWKTYRSYKTKKTEKATLTLKYPHLWRRYTTSNWRIYCKPLKTKRYSAPAKGIKTTITNQIFLKCKAAIVMEKNSGKVVYEYNAYMPGKIASMTKMMTAILLNEGKKTSDTIYISKKAARTPYAFGLKAGDSTSMANIMHALLLLSSNDAATAIGENIAGSQKKFVKMMNAKARKLGCKNTLYTNPHGLDTKRNHSTAYDVAFIGRYILRSGTTTFVKKVVRTKKYFFKTNKSKGRKLYNGDKMLYTKKRFVGIKTGTTGKAGYCFCGAFKYRGKTYITVVMGAGTQKWRWKNTSLLRNYVIWRVKKHCL